jgi:hypothetical protein
MGCLVKPPLLLLLGGTTYRLLRSVLFSPTESRNRSSMTFPELRHAIYGESDAHISIYPAFVSQSKVSRSGHEELQRLALLRDRALDEDLSIPLHCSLCEGEEDECEYDPRLERSIQSRTLECEQNFHFHRCRR